MPVIEILLALSTIAYAPGADGPASDSVTFRDGKVVLGQLVESERRGPLLILVRRAWAQANVADRAATWEKADGPAVKRAIDQRRVRLASWRRDRLANPSGDDRILAWIEREQVRLADPKAAADSPLMVVRLSRADVKAVDRKSAAKGRLVRLGWLSNLPDVETMPAADLTQALEGRGFAPGMNTPVSVDALLPPQPESDARWMARRAATEVTQDLGGRFIRYKGLLLPEPAAGEPPPAEVALSAAVSTVKELLGEPAVDPLPAKLRDLAVQGRVGAVVTRLELAEDFSGSAVEATLWVRHGEVWAPAVSRSASARPGDLPLEAGAALADDPQVKTAFGLFESLGFGEIPVDLKRQGLGLGAATQRALGQARGALGLDLAELAFSLEPAREKRVAEKP